jgi:hypothetical protein
VTDAAAAAEEAGATSTIASEASGSGYVTAVADAQTLDNTSSTDTLTTPAPTQTGQTASAD